MRIRVAQESDALTIARVHVESLKTTYPGIIPDEVLRSLSDEEHETEWREVLSNTDGSQFGFVAEDGSGKIVGLASGRPEPDGDPYHEGQLHKLYLLKAHQRGGIGRQLTSEVARRFLENGVQSMLVWVLAKNPAVHFYKAIGATHLYDRDVEIGGPPQVLSAYGWRDISGLAEKESSS